MRNTLILLSSLALATAASAQSSYRLIDLGIANSATDGLKVNDRGQVLLNLSGRTYLSAPGGGALREVVPPGNNLTGFGLNALGQVTGTVGYDSYLSAPDGGALRRLGTMGERWTDPYAVDATGRVAGTATFWGYPPGSTAYVQRAFLSAPNGGALRDLGTLGGTSSRAYGMNDAGRVTGDADTADGRTLAFLSDPDGGALRSLGTLPAYADSVGRCVNALGQVGGYARRWGYVLGTRIETRGAFLSGPNGGPLTAVDGLGGINGLNDAGQAVGGASLYTSFRGLRSLQGMLDASGTRWTLTAATGISNTGYISASGTYFAGPGPRLPHALLLVPNDLSVWFTTTLGDFRGDATKVPVVVQFRKPGTTEIVSTATVLPDASGRTEAFVQPGTYDVSVKASHWLRRTLRGMAVNGMLVLPSVSLVNGDVNGDNVVSAADRAKVTAALGKALGEPGYDPDCDLTGDGVVTAADRALVTARLGSVGDN